MHRYRAGGRVHRDTAPIIRCMRWRLSTKTFVIHPVRTTTTTPHHTTPGLGCSASWIVCTRRTVFCEVGSPSIPGSSMCKAGIAGIIRCALCSLLFLAGSDALHHGRHEPEGPFSRSSSSPAWHVQGWYCWFFSSRCILSSFRQAQMLGISAGMEQKDSYAACLRPYFAGFAGDDI